MIALSEIVSISADLLSTEIDGEIVMMDMAVCGRLLLAGQGLKAEAARTQMLKQQIGPLVHEPQLAGTM